MAHSDLFRKTCVDARSAWSIAKLGEKMIPARREEIAGALAHLDAAGISELLARMSYAPFNSLAHSEGINDGNALRLSKYLACAALMPYVSRREAGEALDLDIFKLGLIHWIDTGRLPKNFHRDGSDLCRITELIGGESARIALTAPLAAPIEFCIIALEEEHVPSN
jgi:hypothetical protein